jgi:CspA family cold shock protein
MDEFAPSVSWPGHAEGVDPRCRAALRGREVDNLLMETIGRAHFAVSYTRYGAISASKRALGRELFLSERSLLSKVNRMSEGTIKRLTDKGFGFIETSPGKDLFFHMSACEGVRFDELQPGQRVSFVEGKGPKGPRAENVRLV